MGIGNTGHPRKTELQHRSSVSLFWELVSAQPWPPMGTGCMAEPWGKLIVQKQIAASSEELSVEYKNQKAELLQPAGTASSQSPAHVSSVPKHTELRAARMHRQENAC